MKVVYKTYGGVFLQVFITRKLILLPVVGSWVCNWGRERGINIGCQYSLGADPKISGAQSYKFLERGGPNPLN